ncbi:hypothetical protein SAMN05421640_1474 [Ekhidna lutea]|uniref:Lipoprotein n=1 Tax=Ekhidna lutea TaxID=447679 RepID=A0A239HSA7_EKHLU|nr:hypothetical protein [Ekhidna lutea]SNS84192.1 hypothetical protein SAMN05421640_1474 [Ekhidna lutea]
MRFIAHYLIGLLLLTSCVQTENKKLAIESTLEKKAITLTNRQKESDSIGGFSIINTGPRGGRYLNSSGIDYRYTVFRIQIINDTIAPINFDIKLPGSSISLLPDSTIELNVFLVPEKYIPIAIKDTFNFGLDLEKFFESGDPQKFEFNSVIEPNKQSTIYIGMLFASEIANGATRSQLAVEGHDESPHYPVESTVHYHLKNQPLDLIYGISFDAPNNYISIPCGQVRIK